VGAIFILQTDFVELS